MTGAVALATKISKQTETLYNMPKQYGLILPGQQKKKTVLPVVAREICKPSIFDESSSDSDDDAVGPPQLKMRAAAVQGPGVMERRMARRAQEKALEEDPTVYQYDELYDEMDNKREEEKQVKSTEPKKPKYIGRLMEFAERRKLENELRVERQVQKEREEEGEQFKDKESFVTAAYRKKLEEMRKLEDQEKRDEYLEAIGDVTKQKDLDGFYRHLYEQKLGTAKEVQKPGMPTNTSTVDNDEEISYKPIKSGRPQQQRAYRKRHSSNDDEDEDANERSAEAAATEAKKVHLQNNIDADSDFSIDSSSDSEDEKNKVKDGKKTKIIKTEPKDEQQTSKVTQMDPAKIALKFDITQEEKVVNFEESTGREHRESTSSDVRTDVIIEPAKPKKDKIAIWMKRTVGEVFDAAVQRYLERKAARSA